MFSQPGVSPLLAQLLDSSQPPPYSQPIPPFDNSQPPAYSQPGPLPFIGPVQFGNPAPTGDSQPIPSSQPIFGSQPAIPSHPGGVLPQPVPRVIPNLPEHASDRAHAEGVIAHLMSALRGARDPELKTSLSVALAALQKHVAGIHKEHQQMLAGKVSPRLMHEAYSNGNAHGGGALHGGSVL